MQLHVTLAWAVVLAVGCTAGSRNASPAVVIGHSPAAAPPPAVDEDAAIVSTIRSAQEAGLERGDLAAYMAPWDDAAVMTSGRGPKPDPYDVTLSRAQVEATRRIIFTRLPHASIKVDNVEVASKATEAELAWTMTVDMGDRADLFRESYHLRRAPQGWRIARLRYWPIGQRAGGKHVRFDERFFRDNDEAIQQARNAGDDRQLLYLLVGGYRFREARALARTVTAAKNPDSWAWTMRAVTALMTGDAQDAESSYKIADAIDGPE